MGNPTHLYSGIDRKHFFIFMLLIFMPFFTGCSDSDDDSHQISITSDSLNIVRDGIAETCTYGQGKTSFTEVSASGTVEDGMPRNTKKNGIRCSDLWLLR